MSPDLVFDPVLVKSVLRAIFLPPTGLLLVAAAGLLALRRWPRAGRALAWMGVAGLLVLCIPVVPRSLSHLLDDAVPLDRAAAAHAQAIVILGGGVRRNAAEYGGDTLGRLTLERVRYGARVARETGLPVLVTGGIVRGTSAEAHLMRDSLEREFGVPVRWVEDRSRTTHENARRTAEMLLPQGVRDVVLVAHAMDMRRARAEFAAAGLRTVPAPTMLPASGGDSPLDWLPGLAGLESSYYVAYEAIGELVRRLSPAPD